MTYKQLLSIIWRQTGIKNNPARMPCFAYAAKWDDGTSDGKPGWIVYVDENDLPFLLFTHQDGGFSDYYAHVDLPTENYTTMVPAEVIESVQTDMMA
jgi:hypothetical protein